SCGLPSRLASLRPPFVSAATCTLLHIPLLQFSPPSPFTATAATDICTLSLHDALPICIFRFSFSWWGNTNNKCRFGQAEFTKNDGTIQSEWDRHRCATYSCNGCIRIFQICT